MQAKNILTTKEELHHNFLLIQKFLYPDERIKAWVADDIDYNGGYHENWALLMDIVEKLCEVKKMSIWEMLRHLVEAHAKESRSDSNRDRGFDSKLDFYQMCMTEIQLTLNSPE